MKIGLVAYACQPGAGSEPGVGWQTAVQLAQHHEVWLVTRAKNRAAIEKELTDNPRQSLHVDYHELKWAIPLKRGQWGVYPYAYLWQATVYKTVAAIHGRIGLDMAHQITFGSMRFPSSLGRLGIPYVLGPLGGGEEAPLTFWWGLGFAGAMFEALRWLSNRLAMADPLVRRGLALAGRVVAASPATADFLRRRGFESVVIPSVAVDVDDVATLKAVQTLPDARRSEELTALYVGRLLAWKGIHLALLAMARARERGVSVRLKILGRGRYERRLRRLIERLGLVDLVEWLPPQPTLADVQEIHSGTDVFVFPSLHDSGGMVVVEAMAASRPVMCLRLGGPALTVTAATGIRLPALRPSRTLEAMADALIELSLDPIGRAALGAAGRQRVLDEYTWERRGAVFDALYRSVLEETLSRRDGVPS
jgi:glycosyltransferase involved in cell wall biosynthesis